jgi:hypothetical protein
VCAVSSILVLLPLWCLAAFSSKGPLFTAVFFEFIVVYMSTPLVLALAVTIVSPGIRSTATAALLFTGHLLGDAISQPLVGKVSTAIEQGSLPAGLVSALGGFFQTGTAEHLTLAMMTVIAPAAIVSGVVYWIAWKRVE